MKKLLTLVAGTLFAIACGASHADKSIIPSGDAGYWFYHTPPAPATITIPAQVQTPKSPPKVSKPKKKKTKGNPCNNPSTWTISCGFVVPKTFAFQSKQRDSLLQAMVMNPQDPGAVKAVQEYTRWIVGQASYASRVWQYNRLQDPSLSPDATAPISRYGLQMAMQIDTGKKRDVWNAIKRWGGFMVIFSKNDCDYCHAQVAPMRTFARDTGIPVYDASLKGPCLSAYKNHCVLPKKATLPAEILHVSTVPSVFLYLPKNFWVRVSAGLTTTDDIETRTYNFFVGWRLAAKTGQQTGKTGMDLNPADMPKTSQGLRKLLMKPTAAPSGSGSAGK